MLITFSLTGPGPLNVGGGVQTTTQATFHTATDPTVTITTTSTTDSGIVVTSSAVALSSAMATFMQMVMDYLNLIEPGKEQSMVNSLAALASIKAGIAAGTA